MTKGVFEFECLVEHVGPFGRVRETDQHQRLLAKLMKLSKAGYAVTYEQFIGKITCECYDSYRRKNITHEIEGKIAKGKVIIND